MDDLINIKARVEAVNTLEQNLLVEIRGLLEKILNQLIYMDMERKGE